MNCFRWLVAIAGSAVLVLFSGFHDTVAQVPDASGPQKEGCAGGVNCGEKYSTTYNGVVYDCICNCSGQDDCTPRSSSGVHPQKGGRRGAVSNQPSNDNSAIEAEQARQQQERERLAKEQQDNFAKEKNDLETSLKGGASSTSPGLKTQAVPPVQLKSYSSTPAVVLKPAESPKEETEIVTPEQRRLILDNLPDAIQARTVNPNEQAQAILYSLRTKKPPSPSSLIKNIENLQPGDVILVSNVDFADYKKAGGIKNWMKYRAIHFLDSLGSPDAGSPAFHTLIFLGEHFGKRCYLDNTSGRGPHIIDEADFMKEYGKLNLDVASYVGQPISPDQAQEMWRAAQKLQRDVKYGIWLNNRMVCSESSRWVLVHAGLSVPEKKSDNAVYHGVDLGVKKNDFVKFSPADFYNNEQYFIINTLGLPGQAAPAPDNKGQ